MPKDATSKSEQEKLNSMLKAYAEIVKILDPLPEVQRARVIKSVGIMLGLEV